MAGYIGTKAVSLSTTAADVTGDAEIGGDLTVTGSFTSQGIDDNATSTAMTLDSSGNLLVGKTSSTFNNTAGIGQFPSGRIYVTRDGGNCLYLNRVSTDGDIAAFYKDGSVVGSISSVNGNSLGISSSGGVRLFDSDSGGLIASGGKIFPANSSGSTSDNSIDIGAASTRFKDLYLSGGVYLGGTGSANKLDDYEEGTWVPQWKGLSAAGTGAMSYTTKYVKIGQLVTCFIGGNNISLSGGAGGLALAGLPFVAGNTSGTTPSGGCAPLFRNFSWSGDYVSTHVRENTNHIEFWAINNNGGYNQLSVSNIGTELYLTFSYYTD